jgi:hypothetical protein
MALLRVCRQIYSEAAFLPSKLGIFLIDNTQRNWSAHAKSAVSQLKLHQRRQVKNVQFGMLGIAHVSLIDTQYVSRIIWPVIKKLPHLEEIRVLLYSLRDEKPFPNETITIDKPLMLGGREIRVTVQTLDTPWMNSDGEL